MRRPRPLTLKLTCLLVILQTFTIPLTCPQPLGAQDIADCEFQLRPQSLSLRCSYEQAVQAYVAETWPTQTRTSLNGITSNPNCQWPGQTGQTGQDGQTGQTGQSGQNGQAVQTGQDGQTFQVGQPGKLGHTGQPVAALLTVCVTPGWRVRFSNSSVKGPIPDSFLGSTDNKTRIAVAIIAQTGTIPGADAAGGTAGSTRGSTAGSTSISIVTVQNSTFSNVKGGTALSIIAASVTITTSSFVNNTHSSGLAAGLFIAPASSPPGSTAGSTPGSTESDTVESTAGSTSGSAAGNTGDSLAGSAAGSTAGSSAGSTTSFSLNQITISHCSFRHNHASNGAAMFVDASHSDSDSDSPLALSILDSHFHSNTANGTDCDPDTNHQAGGLFLNISASTFKQVSIAITRTLFSQNSALNAGGMLIDMSGHTQNSSVTVNLIDTGFVQNTAVGTCVNYCGEPRCVGNRQAGVHVDTPAVCSFCRVNGGALKVDMRGCVGCATSIHAARTNFTNNSVTGYNVAGAAMMFEMVESKGSSVAVRGDDLAFVSNVVHGNNWADAGAVRVIAVVADSGGKSHADKPKFVLDGTRVIFRDNKCISDCSDAGKRCINSKDKSSVYRSGLGGGLNVDVAGCTQPRILLNVTSLEFIGNFASYVGGALAFVLKNTVGQVEMLGNSSVFENNTAGVNGGATFFTTNGNVTFNMLNNYTVYRGNRALAQLATSSDGFDTGVAGVGTHNGGAAMYMAFPESNTTTLNFRATYALFQGNFASGGKGGAMHISGDHAAGTVSIFFLCHVAIFRDNVAKYGGGAVHLYLAGSNASVHMLSPAWQGSKAGTAQLYGNNTAYQLYGNNTGNELYVNDTGLALHETVAGLQLYENNTALYGPGGAMYINLAPLAPGCTASVQLYKSIFRGNTAKSGGGGAVHVHGDPRDFSPCCCTEACDYSESRTQVPVLSLRQVEFWGNAGSNGGGLFLLNCSAEVVGGRFWGNRAVNGGGALYAKSSYWSKLEDVRFESNSASQGGAVYGSVGDAQESNNLIFTGCHFNNNTASDGGALYLFGSATTLCANTLTNNRATARGGAAVFSNVCGDNIDVQHCSSSLSLNQTAIQQLLVWLTNATQLGASQTTPLLSQQAAQQCDGMAPSLCGTHCKGNLTACFFCPSTSLFLGNTAPAGADVFFSLDTSTEQVAVVNRTTRESQGVWQALAATQPVLSQHQDSPVENVGQPVSALPQGDLLLTPFSSTLMFPSTSGLTGRINFTVKAGNFAGVRVLVQLEPTPRPGMGPYITRFGAVTDVNGVANFADLRVIGADPGLFTLKATLPDYPQVSAQTLNITIRPCIIGEVNAPSTNTCEPCLDGSYAPLPGTLNGSRLCVSCPPGTDCANSSGVAIPRSSHWQPRMQTDNVQPCLNLGACHGNRNAIRSGLTACLKDVKCLARCREYVECMDACRVNTTKCGECVGGGCLCEGMECSVAAYPDMLCSRGYYGHLCGSCSPGYGATKLFTCRKCYRESKAWLLLAIALLMVCAIVILITYNVIDTSLDPDDEHLKASEVFKVLSVHMQQLMIISRLLIEWPGSLSGMFAALQYLQGPSASDSISLDCLGMTPAGKLWIGLCFPMFVALLSFLLLWGLRACFRCKESRLFRKEVWRLATWNDQLQVSIMVSVHFLYATLISTSFTPFTCVLVQSPTDKQQTRYWAFDMRLPCCQRDHLAASLPIAMLSIPLLCIGIPLSLWRGMRHLQWDTTLVRIRFSFLFSQYRPGLRNWEAYVCVNTVLMVAVNMFAKEAGPFHQLLLFLWLRELNRSLTHTLHPFRSKMVHGLYAASAKCIQLTCLAALALQGTELFDTIGRMLGQGGGQWLLRGMNVGGEVMVLVMNVGLSGMIVLVIVVSVALKRSRQKQGFWARLGGVLDPVEGFLARRLGCTSFHDQMDRRKDVGWGAFSDAA